MVKIYLQNNKIIHMEKTVDKNKQNKISRQWLTPFNVVVAVASIALVSLMVFPPYLSLKALAQERALAIASSEARARANIKFASELASGKSCQHALAGLDNIQVYADPHSTANLGNLWLIRKVECIEPTDCVLFLEGTDDDIKGIEISITVPLPVCPDIENTVP